MPHHEYISTCGRLHKRLYSQRPYSINGYHYSLSIGTHRRRCSFSSHQRNSGNRPLGRFVVLRSLTSFNIINWVFVCCPSKNPKICFRLSFLFSDDFLIRCFKFLGMWNLPVMRFQIYLLCDNLFEFRWHDVAKSSTALVR